MLAQLLESLNIILRPGYSTFIIFDNLANYVEIKGNTIDVVLFLLVMVIMTVVSNHLVKMAPQTFFKSVVETSNIFAVRQMFF